MGVRLLFADDSATMQKVIQLALEHEDVELKIAGDGQSALDAATQDPPDVIMADVSMPEMDGFELCKQLKANAGTAHVPVVLITGEMEEYDEGKGADAGASAHLTKPFKSGELLDTIHKLVQNAPGAAEKPAMLELVKVTGPEEEADDEDLEAVAIDSETPMVDPDELDLNLDDLDLQDLDAGFAPAAPQEKVADQDLDVQFALNPHEMVVDQALGSDPVAAPPQINEAEEILSEVFDAEQPKQEIDLNDLETPEAEDELWNNTLRDLGKDIEGHEEPKETPLAAVMEEAEPTFAQASVSHVEEPPPAPAYAPPTVQPDAFRELAEKAVNDFMTNQAPAIFREEMSKAIENHVKDVFETQYEKAFREEISKMIAESFGTAMPQMLGIMEKITLQITPKIAEQMIKTAIEQIKGGEIN